MIPSTVERVPQHTAEHVNQEIRRRTEENVARYAAAGPEAIDRRLAELDREWDIERTLEALEACAGKIRKAGVTRQRHIATEACRRAINGADFLARVRERTGLVFQIIPPREEARLALASCEALIDRRATHVLLVDIGGGSTQVRLDYQGKDAMTAQVEEILEKYWYPGVPNCLVKNEAGYVALPLEATEVVKQQP